MEFVDRHEAGRLLAEKLRAYRGKSVVYALPRGGVETAVEVARELEAPLDLVIARKIGHPAWPEYAVGAVTETGPVIWNESEKIGLDPTWRKQAEAEERAEAKRRREQYLAGHQSVSSTGKVAILIDDGIATGLTMLAAVKEVKKQKPEKIIVAVPCAPRDAVDALLKEVDDVVVLTDPDTYRGAVGAYYQNFPQLNDEEVRDLQAEANDS